MIGMSSSSAKAAQPNLDDFTEPMSTTITRMPMSTSQTQVTATAYRLPGSALLMK
jgi:hypothetical protein